METFNYSPDYSAKVNKKPDTSSVQFGDGYGQRVGKGIISIAEEWDVKFQRESAVASSINSFLEDREGWEAFYWTTPQGKTKKFTCEEWNLSEESYNTRVVSAKFVEEL